MNDQQTEHGAQRMQALERANHIRLGAAVIKRQILAGEIAVTDLLDPDAKIPEVLLSMPIAKLLAAQRRWGPTRCRRHLRALQISENRKVGDLTPRQRRNLVDLLKLMPSERRELLAAA